MTVIEWDLNQLAYGEETRRFIASLTEEEQREVRAWVNAHEADIEDRATPSSPANDYSDGPHLVLEGDPFKEQMVRAFHTCCGWSEGKKMVHGRTLIVASCHGH